MNWKAWFGVVGRRRAWRGGRGLCCLAGDGVENKEIVARLRPLHRGRVGGRRHDWIAGWSWFAAGLFLSAATEPVAVISVFDEAKVRGRIDMLVRAESLVNDGTAATAFAILLAVALGAPATPLELSLAVPPK